MSETTNDHWTDGGVTVGQLREYLAEYSDDCVLVFGPDTEAQALLFQRVKKRGDKLVQIEFVQE